MILIVFCKSGAIIRPCQCSPVIVICLYIAGLEPLFDLVSGVRPLFLLYFAGLDQLCDLVSGVLCLLFACILQFWSNQSTLLEEFGDCYELVLCGAGAIIQPCQWSPLIVIGLYFASLEQLFDLVSGVW